MKTHSRLFLLIGILALVFPFALLACGGENGTAPPTQAVESEPREGAGVSNGSGATPTGATASAQGEAAASARSGSSDPRIADYCSKLGGLDPIDEFETWGEAERHTETSLGKLDDISPPEGLETFHTTLIAFMEASANFFGAQDADQPYDEELFNADEATGAAAFAAFFEAIGLDEDIRSQVVNNPDCGVTVGSSN